MERRTFLTGLAGVATALPATGRRQQTWSVSALRNLPQDDLWQRVRAEFVLRPGLTHLNAATIGSVPRVVINAVTDALWETESHPQYHVFGAPGRKLDDVRAKAAEFLGSTVDEIALTRNTTEGMNTVAMGLGLKAGDQVLTTNHEHPGGRICWDHLAQYSGVEIVEIPMPAPAQSEAQILELVESYLTPRTRVCSFSHICTVTGLQMPLAAIARLTRPRGIVLVCDGAQAPGMLDVNVKALGVDTYASSSHKWLLAPKGSGLLYIRDEIQQRIKPVFLRSGFQAYSASSGTRNGPTILGHGAAVDFHNAIGRARIEERCRELTGYLRSRLDNVAGIRSLTPTERDLSGGITSIALDGKNHREVRTRMHEEFQVVVKTGKAEYNAIRFSTHIFNSKSDVDRAVDVLRLILAE